MIAVMRRTKIVATLGPATDPLPQVELGQPIPDIEDYNYTVMDELIDAGVHQRHPYCVVRQ